MRLRAWTHIKMRMCNFLLRGANFHCCLSTQDVAFVHTHTQRTVTSFWCCGFTTIPPHHRHPPPSTRWDVKQNNIFLPSGQSYTGQHSPSGIPLFTHRGFCGGIPHWNSGHTTLPLIHMQSVQRSLGLNESPSLYSMPLSSHPMNKQM